MFRWAAGGLIVAVEKAIGCGREERERPGDYFWVPKTSDELTGYNTAIVIRWGIKRIPIGTKFGRRSTYNITTPHANFKPIQ